MPHVRDDGGSEEPCERTMAVGQELARIPGHGARYCQPSSGWLRR